MINFFYFCLVLFCLEKKPWEQGRNYFPEPQGSTVSIMLRLKVKKIGRLMLSYAERLLLSDYCTTVNDGVHLALPLHISYIQVKFGACSITDVSGAEFRIK